MAETTDPKAAPSRPGPSFSIESPNVYRAGRELLSLALIDARNHTLFLLSRMEQALGPDGLLRAAAPDERPVAWIAGHVGWFSEWWIARNTQRALGLDCPVRPTRLAGIEPRADEWWGPWSADRADPDALDVLPDLGATRAYLLETLEMTLELLGMAAETDAGLYFYRLALAHEDLRGEQLVTLAQSMGLPAGIEPPPPSGLHPPVLLPATRWTLGEPGAGFSFAQESGRLELDVPEFEIDAQPVTWSQFVEFVDDGGYDREELWQPDGWRWLAGEAVGRRAPRYVEQIGSALGGGGGSIVRQVFGRAVRAAGAQSAVHVSWWEADAWARWAGRRLATEVEWELAAQTVSRRGFRWGDVHEWTAGMLRPWPGFVPDPWSAGTEFDPVAASGTSRVLRGASFATYSRQRTLKRRLFAHPHRDDGFFGFRTCAL